MSDEIDSAGPPPVPGGVRFDTDIQALLGTLASDLWSTSRDGNWRHPRALVIHEPLPTRSYEAIGQFVERFPEVTVAASDKSDSSLRWLQYMPALRGLRLAWLAEAPSLRQLDQVAELRELAILGGPAQSLKVLRHLPLLEELVLEDQGTDFETIADLSHLRALHLERSTTRTVEPLRHLTDLEILAIRNGRVRDLTPISDLPRLRGIDLWSIRGLAATHLAPLGALSSLEALSLFAVGTITDLQSLAGRPRTTLKYLTMEGLSGFRDFLGLAQFSALELLGIYGKISDQADLTQLLQLPQLDVLTVDRKRSPDQADTLWTEFRGRYISINGRVRETSPAQRISSGGSSELLHFTTRARQWVGPAEDAL